MPQRQSACASDRQRPLIVVDQFVFHVAFHAPSLGCISVANCVARSALLGDIYVDWCPAVSPTSGCCLAYFLFPPCCDSAMRNLVVEANLALSSPWRTKGEICYVCLVMLVRSCRVTITDIEDQVSCQRVEACVRAIIRPQIQSSGDSGWELMGAVGKSDARTACFVGTDKS
jgi:hypothetical protein